MKTRVLYEERSGWSFSWFLVLAFLKKKIPFGTVESAETVNRAVLLHLSDGTRFYLGSDKPERVLQWIRSAMKRSEV